MNSYKEYSVILYYTAKTECGDEIRQLSANVEMSHHTRFSDIEKFRKSAAAIVKKALKIAECRADGYTFEKISVTAFIRYEKYNGETVTAQNVLTAYSGDLTYSENPEKANGFYLTAEYGTPDYLDMELTADVFGSFNSCDF